MGYSVLASHLLMSQACYQLGNIVIQNYSFTFTNYFKHIAIDDQPRPIQCGESQAHLIWVDGPFKV